MTIEEARELIPLYAIGALDEKSAQALIEELRALPEETRREVIDWQEVASLIPLALDTQPVPPRVRERLITEIASGTVRDSREAAQIIPFASPRSTSTGIRRFLLIAATILLLITSIVLYRQNRLLDNEIAKLRQQINMQESQLVAQQRELDGVIARATRMVPLSGDAGSPQASAKIFWDTSRQEWVIYVFNLPLAPPDKDYQLWYITREERKISAQVFRPDVRGRTDLKLVVPRELASDLVATAVTLEPRGGSPQPTGQLFLKGAL